MSKRYQYYNCDDPYKILASNLVGTHSVGALANMLVDGQLLIDEAREEIIEGIDIVGMYPDCIIDLLISSNTRRWKQFTNIVADELLKSFDVARAQKELSEFLKELKLL